MNWAVGRSAAGGQIGRGKRSRQDGKPRKEQRHKGRDGCEFSPDPTQCQVTSWSQCKHKTLCMTTIRSKERQNG